MNDHHHEHGFHDEALRQRARRFRTEVERHVDTDSALARVTNQPVSPLDDAAATQARWRGLAYVAAGVIAVVAGVLVIGTLRNRTNLELIGAPSTDVSALPTSPPASTTTTSVAPTTALGATPATLDEPTAPPPTTSAGTEPIGTRAPSGSSTTDVTTTTTAPSAAEVIANTTVRALRADDNGWTHETYSLDGTPLDAGPAEPPPDRWYLGEFDGRELRIDADDQSGYRCTDGRLLLDGAAPHPDLATANSAAIGGDLLIASRDVCPSGVFDESASIELVSLDLGDPTATPIVIAEQSYADTQIIADMPDFVVGVNTLAVTSVANDARHLATSNLWEGGTWTIRDATTAQPLSISTACQASRTDRVDPAYRSDRSVEISEPIGPPRFLDDRTAAVVRLCDGEVLVEVVDLVAGSVVRSHQLPDVRPDWYSHTFETGVAGTSATNAVILLAAAESEADDTVRAVVITPDEVIDVTRAGATRYELEP